MAKDKLIDYDSTAANNTDIGGISIDEGMLPSNVNNALREVMSHLKDFAAGTEAISALDVAGTITSDGLTVDGNATIQNTGNSYRTISLDANRTAAVNTLGRLDYKWNGNEVVRLHATSGSDTTNKDNGSFSISTSDDGTLDQRLKIDSNGDISFYEDTGTTPKLFWDASAEALGIGIAAPTTALDVLSGSSSTGALKVQNASGASASTAILEAINGGGNTRLIVQNDGSVGIGQSSPSTTLSVRGGSANGIELDEDLDNSTDSNRLFFTTSAGSSSIRSQSGNLLFSTGATAGSSSGSERMRLDANGELKITSNGSAADGAAIDLKHSNNNSSDRIASILFSNSVGEAASIRCDTVGANNSGAILFNTTNSGSSDERMRIRSSGSILMSRDDAALGTTGHYFDSSGYVYHTRSGGNVLYLNRKTSDGPLAAFYRSGGEIGRIWSNNSQYIGFGGGDTGLLFLSAADDIRPWNTSTNAARDNAIDLGNSDARFDDIFATNGTIQTSDQNEKQQIASLTDAEITAAKAISKLFKTFKWNDKVEAKGDAARTHAGVIAQDVQQAMSDAGLDAANYAFWCSDTWWETQTEVPAVEAVEAQDAVYDDDGNLVSEAVEAVEAQDAYTRTDTYDTAEEAPEGATERTRMGIRYPELLAFIGAATEQRLADIETRLTALETL